MCFLLVVVQSLAMNRAWRVNPDRFLFARHSLLADSRLWQRLGLEVAEAVAVEPALAELAAPAPALSRTSCAPGRRSLDRPRRAHSRGRNAGAGSGKATAAIPGHLGLDPSIVEQMRELNQPAFPLVAADLAPIHLGQAIGHPRMNRSRRSLRSATVLIISSQSTTAELGVVLTKPLLRLDAGLVRVLRSAAAAVLGPALDQTRCRSGVPAGFGPPSLSRPGSHPSRRPSRDRDGGSNPAILDPTIRTSEVIPGDHPKNTSPTPPI